MESKYNSTLKILPKTEYRDEIVFRIAGDGFLQEAYGRKSTTNIDIKNTLLKVFRVHAVRRKLEETEIKGLIEIVPSFETILYHFDPLEIDINTLIGEIIAIENEIQSLENIELETRLIRLPIVFDESEVRKCIEKYVKTIRPDAPNCKNGSNLEYVASYNGITVEELKEKFLKTEWFVATIGFYPGLPFYLPLDPTCALTAPKYNPPRTWTPEGTVDLADYVSTIFGVPSAGGYQLIGRTAPIFQAVQKHLQFKESPVLLKPGDVIKYYEISEEELHEIYKLVHEIGSGWEYDIKPIKFSLKSWLKMYKEKEKELEEFRKKQEYGRKVTPIP